MLSSPSSSSSSSDPDEKIPCPSITYREPRPTPEAEAVFRRWLANLNEEFTRHQSVDRRSEIVRDELFQMYLGRLTADA